MGQFIRITPFMHVEDPARALAFFTGILGFEVPYRQSGYAYVESEGCDIRIPGTSGGWRAPRQPPIRLTSTCATSMCCMQGSSRGSITRRPAACTARGQALSPARTAGASAGRQPDRVRPGDGGGRRIVMIDG